MATRRFEPETSWLHALNRPACSCHLLLVAEDAEGLAGWCRIFPEVTGSVTTTAILGIGLLPAYRDQGIGSQMVHQALAWAVQTGYDTVRLTVRQDNHRAMAVFTTSGFCITGKGAEGHLEMAIDTSEWLNRQGENTHENLIRTKTRYPLQPAGCLH